MLSTTEIQLLTQRLDAFEKKMEDRFEVVFERFETIQNILIKHEKWMQKHDKKHEKWEKEFEKKWIKLTKHSIILEERVNNAGKGLLGIK